MGFIFGSKSAAAPTPTPTPPPPDRSKAEDQAMQANRRKQQASGRAANILAGKNLSGDTGLGAGRTLLGG